eukprot:TRINITY_DN11679_c0_g2_i1.p1 TRINITY_DN11679_c0_g2~~TRINITY_DN11679_c0_g2_i1.p1  ORF type:complete len:461 (+),score=139.31 TRINITY_DN11679_c0_g2_i1:80-1462(+)
MGDYPPISLGSITCQAWVTDPYVPNLELFGKFIRGVQMHEIVRERRVERGERGSQSNKELTAADEEDVYDEFRMFEYLQHYLRRPSFFRRSCPVPLSSEMRSVLISRYFDLSPHVCADFYGRKLKELRAHRASDKHQLENVKLVYRHFVKDASEEHRAGRMDDKYWETAVALNDGERDTIDQESKLTRAIFRHFELPIELARTYAVICFSTKWMLSLEKLKYAPAAAWQWADIMKVTNAIMQSWSDDHGSLNAAFINALRVELSVAALESYLTDIGRRLRENSTHPDLAAVAATKLAKAVRGGVLSLMGLAGSLSSKAEKLHALYTHCEQWIMELAGQLGYPNAGLDLLLAATGTPLPRSGRKKGGHITDTEMRAWEKFLATISTVCQTILNVGTSGGRIRIDPSMLRLESSVLSHSASNLTHVPQTPDSQAQVGYASPLRHLAHASSQASLPAHQPPPR